MREIVLDTETTGLDVTAGHRLVEIGCLELVNHVPTGRTYHRYLNPQRDVPAEAANVHGLTREILRAYPPFAEIAREFLDFVGDDPLIIHNASFDVGFLNHELAGLGLPTFPDSQVVDTLAMARRRFPGAPASLDALCKRFDIDNTQRELHGALLDSELLAEVYLQLLGGRQPNLSLAAQSGGRAAAGPARQDGRPAQREPRPHAPNSEEAAAHAGLLARLKKPIWHWDDGAPADDA